MNDLIVSQYMNAAFSDVQLYYGINFITKTQINIQLFNFQKVKIKFKNFFLIILDAS